MKKQFNINAKLMLRIAATCLFFFAIGHGIGHYTRHNITDPKAIDLQKQMMENKFDMFGVLRSYDENYTGMSLNLIFTLLAMTIVLWQFSEQAENYPAVIRKLLIPLTLCVMGFGITSALYFFLMPAFSSFAAGTLMFIAIFGLREEKEEMNSLK